MTAWVVGYFDPVTENLSKVCVEAPARQVDGARATEMLDRVREAIENGPPPVEGAATAPPTTELDPDEVNELIGRLISAWVDSLENLWLVADERDPTQQYPLYARLVQVLNWAYTVDQALQGAWNRVPGSLKMPASQEADARIEAAMADLQARSPGWEPSDEPVFRPYIRRQAERRPYSDWASVVVAGSFHEEFFGGLNWVSGKMRHSAAGLPIELRQMRPGGEPRWKWKLADAIAPSAKDKDKAHRKMYIEHLQEQDVLGLFAWLVNVFGDARHLLTDLLRQAESSARAPSSTGDRIR